MKLTLELISFCLYSAGNRINIHNLLNFTSCLLILQVIAGCLSEEEIKGLKEMFKNMDSDNSGTITLEELEQGLAKQGTKLSEHEVKQLMEAVCSLLRHFNSF